MNVLAVKRATGQQGRAIRNVTPRLHDTKLFKCFHTRKTIISSHGARLVLRQCLRHGDEVNGQVKENPPVDSLDERPEEQNIQSKTENDGEEVNGRSSIIRRLARAVVTFMSPAPLQSVSKFLSLRAFKLALFLVLGLCMSYVGSRRSSTSPRTRYAVMRWQTMNCTNQYVM
jgi:hypothetical protein